MQIGRFLARAVIGSLFIGHGAQKLLGSFDGPGIEGTSGMMESLDMRPARRNAYAAGASEAGGGALLLAGLATPLACAALIGTMVTAVRKVHLPNGLWATNGGYEYNVALIAFLVALAEDGPGDLSLDRLLGTERTGRGWGLFALVLGLVASTLAIEAGRSGDGPGPGPSRDEPGEASAAPSDTPLTPYPATAGDAVGSDAVDGGVR